MDPLEDQEAQERRETVVQDTTAQLVLKETEDLLDQSDPKESQDMEDKDRRENLDPLDLLAQLYKESLESPDHVATLELRENLDQQDEAPQEALDQRETVEQLVDPEKMVIQVDQDQRERSDQQEQVTQERRANQDLEELQENQERAMLDLKEIKVLLDAQETQERRENQVHQDVLVVHQDLKETVEHQVELESQDQLDILELRERLAQLEL